MRRYRNTKIVATLGPSSRTKRQIRSMIKAGVDVFRLNFSHGSHEDHRSRFNAIRQLEKELDWPLDKKINFKEVSSWAELEGTIESF